MVINKRYFTSLLAGLIYGIGEGLFLWVVLFCIWEVDLFTRKNQVQQIEISYLGFPLSFFPTIVFFGTLACIIRLILKVFVGEYIHIFIIWAISGLIPIAIFNLIILTEENPIKIPLQNHQITSLGSVEYLWWLLTLMIVIGYTFLFLSMKNLARYRIIKDTSS